MLTLNRVSGETDRTGKLQKLFQHGRSVLCQEYLGMDWNPIKWVWLMSDVHTTFCAVWNKGPRPHYANRL